MTCSAWQPLCRKLDFPFEWRTRREVYKNLMPTWVGMVSVTVWLHVQGSVKEMMNLSQQDYVKRIEELNQALITAWEQDQRVKSLKIAIQVSFSPCVLFPPRCYWVFKINDLLCPCSYSFIRALKYRWYPSPFLVEHLSKAETWPMAARELKIQTKLHGKILF